MKVLLFFTAGVLISAISSLVTWNLSKNIKPEDPVYVVGSVSVHDAARLPEYQSRAQPIAHAAGGYAPLAMGSPTVLEGSLPAPGHFFVEQFESEEALRNFLEAFENSDVAT